MTSNMFWMRFLVFALLAGCGGSVTHLYEEQRLEALAAPSEVPSSWSPNGRIAISQTMLLNLAKEATADAMSRSKSLAVSTPGFTANPNLELTSLSLKAGNCENCLTINLTVAGSVAWKLLTKSGVQPFDASAEVEVSAILGNSDGSWTLRLKPKDVGQVSFSTNGWSGLLDRSLASPLEEWLADLMIEAIPTKTLVEVPSENLPVRDARVAPDGGNLVLELLLHAQTFSKLQPLKLKQGWSVSISQDALVQVARSESFRQGADENGVVVTPTRLTLDRQSFELTIRIWRLVGRGWWRDYRVSGDLAAKTQTIKLTATDVEKIDQSSGAAVVDPLAALGQSLILRAIEEALNTSLPSEKRSKHGTSEITLRVKGVRGSHESIVITGVAIVE